LDKNFFKDEARARECLGCSEAECDREFSRLLDFNGTVTNTVASMLSDVQEMIARGMREDARQAINRIKIQLYKNPSPSVREDA